MNKLEAKNLIINTFENPFDEGTFTYFIKNLLNNLDESKRKEYRGQYVPESFSDAVKHYKRIGQYIDSKNNVIDVLIVNLNRGTSLERARSLQRNFTARYLKLRTHDAALVAYYTDGNNDWRFSLVKMDINLNNKKIETDFTPARRYSFLVGTNEGSHTAQNQFVKLITEKEENPTLDKIEDAFNIETVTKEFFLKYRDLFILIKQALDKVIKNDSTLEVEFKSKEISSVDFAKKLLGQIVFLYFLQKKGWFGVEKNSKWGSGSKKFLREIYEKKHGIYNNFFNDILEPLFYEALRNDRSYDDHYYSRFNCKIPFLNGGLFDPIGNYDWSKTDIILPNELFSNSHQTKEGDIGDGILDVFDRYNFTVIEDEPLEKEVAIDPELLGKAYEKFNAIRLDNFDEYLKALKSGKKGDETKFNKQYGVFYTPREIVHYMCQQSLITYLSSELSDSHSSESGNLNVPKKAIEFLILEGEKFVEYLRTAKEKNEKNEDYTGKYKENDHFLELKEYANEIDNLLANVKMCDPAVGSGAFPVGMMSEIVKARMFFVLTNCLDDKYINPHSQLVPSGKIKRNPYNFKRDCIENSLYGVDIDSGAVEIAKLRLWLSLVVDEDDINNIKPLPNLDYKIVQGNSLLGVKKDLLNAHLFDELEKLKPLLFNETNPTKKQEYKKQIDGLILKLSNGHKDFDFEVYFSEVFHQKDGFDILIANPPYVRADNPSIKQQREAIKTSNVYKTLWEKWDLYVAFIERGFNTLANKGILEFIISDAYMSSKYAEKSHNYFLNNAIINRINFCSELKIFEAAVKNIIIEYKKEINPNHIPLRIKHIDEWDNFIFLPSKKQSEMGENTFRLDSENKTIGYLSNTLTWGEICYVSYGLRPSSDERYWKGEFTKDELISDIKDSIHPKAYIEGKWINKYIIEKIKYLEWGTNRSPKKLVRPTFPELYVPEKILMGGMTGSIYDNTGLLCNHSITVSVLWKDLKGINNRSIEGSIKKDFKIKTIYPLRNQLEENSKQFNLKYLLAILNSKFAYKFLDSVRRSQIGFYPDDLKKLPIKKILLSEQNHFIELVNQILSAKEQNPQANTKQLEDQIDIMVYKLYNLTYEEVKIIDPNIEQVISEEGYERFEIN